MDKLKFNYGLALFILVGIFAIDLIAVLNPDELSIQGALVLGFINGWGGQVVTFFFRKAPDDKEKEITALRNKIKGLEEKKRTNGN